MRAASARRLGKMPDLVGVRSVGKVAIPRKAITSSFGAVGGESQNGRRKDYKRLTLDEGDIAAFDGAHASAEELRAESCRGESDLGSAESIERVGSHRREFQVSVMVGGQESVS